MKIWIASLLLCSFMCDGAPVPEVVRNRKPLAATAYTRLPLGSVKPKGWLERQLRIQADGLTGHLDGFWPYLGPNSGWLGGDGESWERGPYFLDGLVPLAFLLDDTALIGKANRWVNWTLEHQRPYGSIGPAKNTDWWPNFVMLKVLTQYHEATGDPRVIPLMQRYFSHQLARLDAQPLKSWAVFRWQDEVLSLIWLYNRTGDLTLLELAGRLRAQGHDWLGQFAEFRYKEKTPKPEQGLPAHIVNNAMALKTGGVWYQISGDRAHLDGFYHQLRELDRYHLQPNGVHSGDEHLAGLNPTQGTELCAVVESMFSLEHLLAVTGDAQLGDRLEKVTYNPLPGTFSKDMWAHQYDQQANQVLCSVSKREWTSNSATSNLFGLEPHFGCCTANMHQGWPKFVASLWMATQDEGLAAVAFGPSQVTAPVRGGVMVTILEETEYPFRDTIRLTIKPARAVTFPLELRIPAWAANARIRVNGQAENGLQTAAFHKIERLWKPGDVVEIVTPMDVRIARGYRDSITVERGPLVYSLQIGEHWTTLVERAQAPDFEVRPTTPWNFGLLVDPTDPAQFFEVEERPLRDYPFSPEGAPVILRAKGRRIPDWQIVNDSAGPLPESPAESKEKLEAITLIPYGSAKLRITAFPQLVK